MKTTITMVITLLLFISAHAIDNNDYFNTHFQLPSLINPSNFSMSHSLSTASSFYRGTAFYQSSYTNHLNYRLSSKLDLKVDLNFVNYGTANYNSKFNFDSNNDNQTRVLPDFSLTFKPSENTMIRVEYRTSVPINQFRNSIWD
ncbi:MAG: hypothetical protein PHR06_04490 [Candidatus Cloacimonetes bacterium]|nr:hypothetical protein [Candidatus Cloacimonadota bacterium]